MLILKSHTTQLIGYVTNVKTTPNGCGVREHPKHERLFKPHPSKIFNL
ncbi:MAG: hypothetical protein AABY02_03085 [Nanoarchaeota archaeon]